MNRDTVVKKTLESQIQSNLSTTVTRKKWCGDRYIQGREFIMNRDTVVKKTLESQIQSNLSTTVTRKKWCGDRYIQGRYIQV